METLVWLLVFFIVLNTAVKMSLWKMWQQIACCLVIGLLVFGATHYVVLLSKTQLEAMVQQTAVLRDVAVVLTVDAAVCTAFCLLWLNEEQPRSRMGRCMWAALYAYPQLLVLPALGYALAVAVFAAPGVDFVTLGVGFAFAAVALLLVLSLAMRWLLPVVQARVELHLLLSGGIAAVGLVATQATRMVYGIAETPVRWKAMLATLAGFALLMGVGFLADRLKKKMKNKK